MATKRRASENDKKYLSELIVKYQHIVENKKSDAVSNIAKRDGWAKITSEFNAQRDGEPVTVDYLKRSWENLKAKRKKQILTEKQMRLQTGGGSYHPSAPQSPSPDLDSLLQRNLDIEIEHFKDSDGIQFKKMATPSVHPAMSTNVDRPITPPSMNHTEDSVPITSGPSHEPRSAVLPVSPGPSHQPRSYNPGLKQNSSSYYLSQASCLQDKKVERLKRIGLLMEDDREYHSERMLVLQQERKYWERKEATEKAAEEYWLMKKNMEEKILQAQLHEVLERENCNNNNNINNPFIEIITDD